MIKAIIFDVDGVLINQELFSDRISKEYGIKLETILPFFKGIFGDCQLGKANLKNELKKVINSWGWSGTVDDLINYWFFGSELNLNNNLLKEIAKYKNKGIKCYIATNQEKYRGKFIKEILDKYALFVDIFISSSIGSKKPDKDFFEYITKSLLEIKSNEILVWDSDDQVVVAAKKYKMNSEKYSTLKRFQNKMKKYL